MIKFFRKIRQRLLTENKFSRYLLYAFGEIFLVVIGILIAIQINNRNEEKKGKAELNQYLSSLKENIKSDLRVLDSLSDRREVTVAYCEKERLNFLNKTFNFMDTRYALRSYVDFYFVPNTSAYEALKNSPYLGKINGTDLNNSIIAYYAKIVQIAEGEKSYNEFVENLEAKLAYDVDRTLVMAHNFMDKEELSATKTTQDEIYQVFKELHESIGYRNIVSQATRQEESIIVPYNQAKAIGINIIDEIDNMVNH